MAVATTDEAASSLASLASDGSQERTRGWAEAASCAVCNAELGKRKLNPRHHCRICGKSVCSLCSPSTIKFEGEKSLQRACTPCVPVSQQAPTLKDRLIRFSTTRNAIGGGANSDLPSSLEQAVLKCEAMLTSIQDQRDGNEAAKTELQGMKLKLESVCRKANDLETALKQEQLTRRQTEEQLGEVQKLKQAMETRASELEASLRHEQQSRQQSQDQLEKLQARHQAEETRSAGLEASLAQERQSKQQIEEQLDVLRVRHQTKEARVAELEAKLKDQQQAAAESKGKLQQMRLSQAQLQQQLDEVFKLQKEFQSRAAEAEVRLERERQAHQELETNLADSRRQLEATERRFGEAESCSQILRQQIEADRQEHGEVSACSDRAEAWAQELQRRHKEALQQVQVSKDEVEEAAKLRSVLQACCNGLEESLQQEREAQKALEVRVQSASQVSAAENSPDSAAQDLASSNAALALAESEVKQAHGEKQRLEQAAVAAKETLICMATRLGVLAGQEVPTTEAGESFSQQEGLEDAVAACEALIPKLKALAAKEQAENCAADCKRQLLYVGASTTSTIRATCPSSGPSADGGSARASASNAGPRQTCVKRFRCTVM